MEGCVLLFLLDVIARLLGSGDDFSADDLGPTDSLAAKAR